MRDTSTHHGCIYNYYKLYIVYYKLASYIYSYQWPV